MRIRIERLHPEAVLPEYAHGPDEDAGMDLRAVESVVLEPGMPKAVPTGLAVELPPGFEAPGLAAWDHAAEFTGHD